MLVYQRVWWENHSENCWKESNGAEGFMIFTSGIQDMEIGSKNWLVGTTPTKHACQPVPKWDGFKHGETISFGSLKNMKIGDIWRILKNTISRNVDWGMWPCGMPGITQNQPSAIRGTKDVWRHLCWSQRISWSSPGPRRFSSWIFWQMIFRQDQKMIVTILYVIIVIDDNIW